MKLKICLMGLLCLFFLKASAQNYTGGKGLKIGDQIPDILIDNVINYSTTSIKFSQFKDKLIILDFWATSCGSCIEMFPEEVALQNKYKDSIQFLLVDSKNTRDTKERVLRFFNAHQAYKKLPSVVDDTLLFNLFPHQSEPHYAWIKNNVVLAITASTDVNERNIDSLLEGKHLKLSEKKDIYTSYDNHKPLFINGNGGNPTNYLFRSILVPYKADLKPALHFVLDSNNQVIGYRIVNHPRLNLYLFAYPEFGNFDENRMVFQVAHPNDYLRDSTSLNWKNRNLFIYEASFPPTTKSGALKIMRDDLDRFFHLSIDSELRDVPCLVIKRGKSKAESEKSRQQVTTFDNETFVRDFVVSDLTSYINSRSKLPVVNESEFTGTIRMNSEISDLSANDVMERLKKEGFTITHEKRKLSYLVLSENPNSK